jgi:hypothetical protein
VERRRFALLTGAALTIPAHQWLIRDPEPLVSGLSSGRISVALVDQLPSMITTLRTMDDAAGGGIVLAPAQQAFGWVAGLLAAVAKARTQVEQFESDSDPRWLYWVTPAEITAGAGDCLLQLGQSGQATALLESAIAMLDESFARDRQIYLIHLADALARPGKQRDLDAAADRGLAAVHLAESLTSPRGIDCLRDLYRKMQSYASVPAVGDFLERARRVLAHSDGRVSRDTQGVTSGFRDSSRRHQCDRYGRIRSVLRTVRI